MKLNNAPRRALLAVGVWAVVSTPAAHAVVLQQKWTAGQQLAYDTSATGTVNVQLPPDANNILAGLPIEIDLKLQGQTALDTLSVDDAGTGTVAMRLNPLKIQGDMLGQNLLLNVKDGKGAITINGKAMGGSAAATDWSAFNNPINAMRISKVGRMEGLTPIKAQAAPSAAPGAAGAKSKARGPMPVDMQGMVGAMMLRALPTLWPDHEVNVGDKWSSALNLPVTSSPNGAAPTAIAPGAPLGKFDFVLRGEEEIEGRKTERIGMKGTVDVDEDTATTLTGVLPFGNNAPKLGGAGLQHAHQQLTGDLWFDAAAGQVVRGEFDVQSQVTTHPAAPTPTANDAGDKPPTAGSTMSFNGTVQMQLRKVSYASNKT